ncbi:MAG: RNA polymerase sigma factor [Planctomycetota bacterium]
MLTEKIIENRKFLELLKKNDQQATHYFISMFNEKLYKYFLISGLSRDDCAELTQQTFYNFFKKLRTTPFPYINNITSYLFKIAKNCMIDYVRRYQTQKKVLDEYTGKITNLEDGKYTDNIALVLSVLTQLEPYERDIVIFHLVLGHTFKEISKILNISTSRVKRLFYKTFEKLRTLFFNRLKVTNL